MPTYQINQHTITASEHVADKAVRLARDGAVELLETASFRAFGKVQGDHGRYNAVVTNDMKSRCSCQATIDGFCSHALAVLLTAERLTALAQPANGSSRLAARSTDPRSSHKMAKKAWGAKGGLRGMKRDIMAVVGPDWMTCHDIVVAVFGPGPYTYEEAIALNKVQTIALKLWREGYLDRLEQADELLQYRSRTLAERISS